MRNLSIIEMDIIINKYNLINIYSERLEQYVLKHKARETALKKHLGNLDCQSALNDLVLKNALSKSFKNLLVNSVYELNLNKNGLWSWSIAENIVFRMIEQYRS